MTDDATGDSPLPPASLEDMLGSLSLGPSWVREAGRPLVVPEFREEDERGSRKGGRFGDDRRGGGRGFGGDRREPRRDSPGGGDRRDQGPPRGDRGPRGNFRGPGGGGGPRREWQDRDEGRRPERAEAEEGVTVMIRPSQEAMAVLAKQVHHGARVYSLLDVAHLILGGRDRYRLVFKADASHRPLLRGVRDDSLWLGEAEAMAHFRRAAWRSEMYVEEEVEIDPPRGTFVGVARCGLTGQLIAPPNFHAYQAKLRQLHRDRFAQQMSFERYVSNVRVDRSEEAVQEWMASMTKRRQWRPLEEAQAETILTSEADLEGHFRHHYFDKELRATSEADLPGNISGDLLSPSLLASLRRAGSHVRNHPAMLIPTVCQMLDKQHVAIFKREGKLFTGPSRPHPLGPEVALSERPSAIVAWAREHPGAKLTALWEGLLPEGPQPPPAEWAADFLWLLHQGYLLLTKDDRLLVPGVEGGGRPPGDRGGQRPPREPRPPRPQAAPAPAVVESAPTPPVADEAEPTGDEAAPENSNAEGPPDDQIESTDEAIPTPPEPGPDAIETAPEVAEFPSVPAEEEAPASVAPCAEEPVAEPPPASESAAEGDPPPASPADPA